VSNGKAYLNDDIGGGTSTLVIAYQESIAGTIVTIKLKSYQIQGMKDSIACIGYAPK